MSTAPPAGTRRFQVQLKPFKLWLICRQSHTFDRWPKPLPTPGGWAVYYRHWHLALRRHSPLG